MSRWGYSEYQIRSSSVGEGIKERAQSFLERLSRIRPGWEPDQFTSYPDELEIKWSSDSLSAIVIVGERSWRIYLKNHTNSDFRLGDLDQEIEYLVEKLVN